MKRKFQKLLFSISAVSCFLSTFTTSGYAETSKSTAEEDSSIIWFTLGSSIFILVLVSALLLFKLTEKGGYGVSIKNSEKAAIKVNLPDRTQNIVEII